MPIPKLHSEKAHKNSTHTHIFQHFFSVRNGLKPQIKFFVFLWGNAISAIKQINETTNIITWLFREADNRRKRGRYMKRWRGNALPAHDLIVWILRSKTSTLAKWVISPANLNIFIFYLSLRFQLYLIKDPQKNRSDINSCCNLSSSSSVVATESLKLRSL